MNDTTEPRTRSAEIYAAAACTVTWQEDADENVLPGTITRSAPYLDDASVLWEMAEDGGYDTDAGEWVYLPDEITIDGAHRATADVTAMDALAALLRDGLAGDGTWDGAADHLDAVAEIVRSTGRDLTFHEPDDDEPTDPPPPIKFEIRWEAGRNIDNSIDLEYDASAYVYASDLDAAIALAPDAVRGTHAIAGTLHVTDGDGLVLAREDEHGTWTKENDDDEQPHAPDPGCYACRGTGTIRGFGAVPGAPCPCTTATIPA